MTHESTAGGTPTRYAVRVAIARVLLDASNYVDPVVMWGEDFTRLVDLTTDSVLSLLPGRTETEVKAGVLRDAAENIYDAKAEDAHAYRIAGWLHGRADLIDDGSRFE